VGRIEIHQIQLGISYIEEKSIWGRGIKSEPKGRRIKYQCNSWREEGRNNGVIPSAENCGLVERRVI